MRRHVVAILDKYRNVGYVATCRKTRATKSVADLGDPGYGGEEQPSRERGGGLGRHTDSTIRWGGPEFGCFGVVCWKQSWKFCKNLEKVLLRRFCRNGKRW